MKTCKIKRVGVIIVLVTVLVISLAGCNFTYSPEVISSIENNNIILESKADCSVDIIAIVYEGSTRHCVTTNISLEANLSKTVSIKDFDSTLPDDTVIIDYTIKSSPVPLSNLGIKFVKISFFTLVLLCLYILFDTISSLWDYGGFDALLNAFFLLISSGGLVFIIYLYTHFLN